MEQGVSVKVNDLNVSYNGEKALENITFSLPTHELIGIVGPNGAGKSTLMKSILGLIPTSGDKIEVYNQPVNKFRKHIAYVPQRNHFDMDFPVLVEDVVVMGRYTHLPWWKRPTKNDKKVAMNCLDQVGMLDFQKRQIGELSGGQQQRVLIARALAQEAELLLLDEPFAGIDVTSEKIIIDILRKLRDQGKTLLVVHHDLSKVETYFDSLILLNKKLIASGKSKDIFKAENIEKAYEGNVAIIPGANGTMVVSG